MYGATACLAILCNAPSRLSGIVSSGFCNCMDERPIYGATMSSPEQPGLQSQAHVSPTPAPLRVIVSHPARQANIYYRPCAAEQMGADVSFLTGLYYRPDRFPYSAIQYLPAARREKLQVLLEKRRIEGLSPENVISLLGPLLEVTLRPLGKIEEWWAVHDWLASRWIAWDGGRDTDRTTPTVLHCFQGACRRTLRAGRARKMIRLLEVTLPTMAGIPELAGEEPSADTDVTRLKEELCEAEFVLVQSEFSARSVQALGIGSQQILRCHLGVDTQYFKPRSGSRRPGPLRVLFLGGGSRRKGVHYLLEAWRHLNAPEVELLIAGNRTVGLGDLPKDIRNCRILGRVSDKDFLDLLQQTDILVHPSLAEGGCNVVYEALACGVPAIVSNNASSAVRDGREGMVVPVGDADALRAAIERLCREPGLRRQMASAARLRAESLRWDNYLVNLAHIYRGLGDYAGRYGSESLTALGAARF
jgi:glycosyltransferase involved in cell wall biosynthesis